MLTAVLIESQIYSIYSQQNNYDKEKDSPAAYGVIQFFLKSQHPKLMWKGFWILLETWIKADRF